MALCTPSFLLPSLLLNYFFVSEYSIMVYAKRDMVVNLWLLPNGRQIIAETYDGNIRKINIKDFYKFEDKKTRFRLGSRIEMYHGSNNYLFLNGNPTFIDQEVLDAVKEKRFIDTKNMTFDFDTGKNFTWEIDQLMQSDVKRVTLPCS